jgi:iron complex transport system substrate-binding protein
MLYREEFESDYHFKFVILLIIFLFRDEKPYIIGWIIQPKIIMILVNKRIYQAVLLILVLQLSFFYGNSINYIEAATVQANELSYPLLVKDDFGRYVTIPNFPYRIVSLAPSATEILFAIGAGTKVVGVTEYCDYPPEVLNLVEKNIVSVIGGFKNPNIEAIISLQPDLVIAATTVQYEIIQNLESKGVIVVGLNPKNIEQILSNIDLIGLATDHIENSEKLSYSLRKRMEYISYRIEKTSYRPRVYYELWDDPLMTIGPGTWIDEIIRLGGGINIFNDSKTPYPTINFEVVIERNPELIIIPLQYMGTISVEDFKARPGWSSIEAVEEGRVYEVDEDILVRPSPRIIDGLEQIALLIHPELYTNRIDVDRDTIMYTNSSIIGYVHDDNRKLINFTLKGPEESAGFINVTFMKSMIEGSPIVLLDEMETSFDISQNETHYSIYFSYVHSTHKVTIGGTYTIKEFNFSLIPLLIAVFTIVLITQRLGTKNSYVRRAVATS